MEILWGFDEEPAEAGSPRVILYGYDGLLMQPVAPPSPDYVPGPEHQPSPDYVPGYVADSDPDEDPEEDPEEDHADYLADGWDGDDEPFDDDDDDTDDEGEEASEDEDDDEEKEEHLAPTDSSAVPVTRLCRAHKTIRLEPPMLASIEARIAEHVVAPTLPLPVSSPPLPLPSPLTTSPTNAGIPLGYKAAGIRMRALLPSTSHRTDILEAEMPPRKRACFTTPAPRLEIRESSAAGVARQPGPTLEVDLRRDKVGEMSYGITNTWDEIDTEEFQVRFEDAQDDRAFLRVRVNTLFRDRSAAIEALVRTLEAQVATLTAQTSSLQT
ncbi:hypothetical protein Tco_0594146 [Tanacetum coccineum]